MKVLGFAGFPMGETYTIIKAISKKKKYVIDSAKPKFIKNFAQAILDTGETSSQETAHEMATKVWTIIENSASYGFNCSHSYCMAIDSVTLAWLKAHYPYEFYKVTLQRYTDKGDKDKVTKLKKEMSDLGVKLQPIKFGDDNRKFSISPNHEYITQTMASIKNMQKLVPDVLYKLGKHHYNDFLQILYDIKHTKIDTSSLDILIKLDYFSEFGDINYLLNTVKIYNKYIGKGEFGKRNRKQFPLAKLKEDYYPVEVKAIKKFHTEESKNHKTLYVSKENIYKLVQYLVSKLKQHTTTIYDKMKYEAQLLGYVSVTLADSPYWVVINTEVNQYGSPFATLYRASDGFMNTYKLNKQYYNEYSLSVGDIITPVFNQKFKSKKQSDGSYIKIDETYTELSMWNWKEN